LVNRTRATLRSAEFGFFGVCVYTRMHTPRFSGQPTNAGDFVLLMTASRPMRTSCENVGTVFPLFSATPRPNSCANLRGSRLARRQKNARACASAERSTANPEEQPARNSVRTPRGRAILLVSVRRGLLGFAGQAPHSGRSSVPFRLACSGTEDNTLPTQRLQNIRNRPTQVSNIPDKQRSIRKTACSVKCEFSSTSGKVR